jgi:hypothetical protein
VLHGQRRTGKTSFLYQLLNGRLPDQFIPALIDMQGLAVMVNDTNDFLSEIAYTLAQAVQPAGIELDEPDLSAAPTRLFNRFLDSLEMKLGDRRIVLMVDEFELIEAKISEGKLESEILGYFRSLIQHRKGLIFIFVGTHHLQEMSHDYWSILFNIALHRKISFLSETDSIALIRNPVAGKLDIDDLAVEKIIQLTNGHPYFIQLLCWALINHCNAEKRNYATINDVNDALEDILTTGEAHFSYIWQQAAPTEQIALAGLAHTDKLWARPAEIIDTLQRGGVNANIDDLKATFASLTTAEVIETATEGALRYRYQLEVLRRWVIANRSIGSLSD